MIHLVTTPATVGHCGRCGALVLTGYAEGLRARVDPTPLNHGGWTAAILARRPVYTLIRTGLVEMDAGRIGDRRIRGPTLAQHKCGHHTPPQHIHATPTPGATNPEGIPY